MNVKKWGKLRGLYVCRRQLIMLSRALIPHSLIDTARDMHEVVESVS